MRSYFPICLRGILSKLDHLLRYLKNFQHGLEPISHVTFIKALGHDVERCYALKNAVQDLIEDNTLTFPDLDPNV